MIKISMNLNKNSHKLIKQTKNVIYITIFYSSQVKCVHNSYLYKYVMEGWKDGYNSLEMKEIHCYLSPGWY